MHSSSLSVSDDCDVFRGAVNTVDCDAKATAYATAFSLCYLVFVAAIINSTVLLTMSEECPHELNAHCAPRILGCKNTKCGNLFADVFAYK